jgi:threonine dehydrogenase-like Zn-dependent dehydrogenase
LLNATPAEIARYGGKIAILGIPSKDSPRDLRKVIFNRLTIDLA